MKHYTATQDFLLRVGVRDLRVSVAKGSSLVVDDHAHLKVEGQTFWGYGLRDAIEKGWVVAQTHWELLAGDALGY